MEVTTSTEVTKKHKAFEMRCYKLAVQSHKYEDTGERERGGIKTCFNYNFTKGDEKRNLPLNIAQGFLKIYIVGKVEA